MIASRHAAALAALIALGAPASAQENPLARQPERPAAAEPAPPSMSEPRSDRGVEIQTLLEQFAASSGKKLLIDPRVRARVSAAPAIETPTYPELLSILRMHGYMAVEIEGRLNIIPDANARHMPTRLLQRDDRSIPDDEWVTRVLEVPGGQAPQLVPILRPMMPQAAHLAATMDGKLVIVDTYANVRRITEIVNTLAP